MLQALIKNILGYKWSLAFSSLKLDIDNQMEHQLHLNDDHYCVLYETSGRELSAHYSPIINIDINTPKLSPNCKIYSLTGEDLTSHMCNH